MSANSEREIKGMSARMAYDIAEYKSPEISGIESGFYVGSRGLPWHVALSRRLDVPELMQDAGGLLTAEAALDLAGLGFRVAQEPIHRVAGVSASRHKKYEVIEGWVANVRQDTGGTLGIVKPTYRVLQNADAFAFADSLVDDGSAKYETAGSLFGGKLIFLSMEIPDEIHVEGDPSDYRLFLVISNGHDGRHAAEAFVTVERVMCKNTLKAGRTGAISHWSIRHTTGLDGRLQVAREALGLSFRYAEAFSETASALVAKPLAERQVEEIIRSLFPIPERDQDKPERFPMTTAGKVMEVYMTSPSIDPIQGTAYGVLNAVTEYLDHVQEYRGRVAQADEVRADSLLFGGTAEAKKQAALDLLVKIG